MNICLYFFKRTTDYWLKLAYEKYLLEFDDMLETEEEAFEKICDDSNKIIYLFLETDAIFVGCKIIKIPTCILKGWVGFLLREKSPYKNVFNRL